MALGVPRRGQVLPLPTRPVTDRSSNGATPTEGDGHGPTGFVRQGLEAHGRRVAAGSLPGRTVAEGGVEHLRTLSL